MYRRVIVDRVIDFKGNRVEAKYTRFRNDGFAPNRTEHRAGGRKNETSRQSAAQPFDAKVTGYTTGRSPSDRCRNKIVGSLLLRSHVDRRFRAIYLNDSVNNTLLQSNRYILPW